MADNSMREETKKRREAVEWCDANDRLEGIEPLKPGTFAWELQEKWVNGEITTEERLRLTLAQYGMKYPK